MTLNHYQRIRGATSVPTRPGKPPTSLLALACGHHPAVPLGDKAIAELIRTASFYPCAECWVRLRGGEAA